MSPSSVVVTGIIVFEKAKTDIGASPLHEKRYNQFITRRCACFGKNKFVKGGNGEWHPAAE